MKSGVCENFNVKWSQRYFAACSNAPIGIILNKNKDELLVEYATYGMDSNLFVSKYELYLPNRRELERLVKNNIEDDKNHR
ncbi:PDDEXK nuclease domain-containing protein [Blautia producta]|uniref:YhcG PDDEXK nuclease domain-containing protein n=1 Tax=Blautia producta TaxID=33035 RepID=A0A4P6LX86_9FIRM|nr:PDDEXK nuclease domain-containing protein [Blautia producta]QBE96502.1 hypothetical protein PMF13cell1_02048 [Blautia producta]